MKSLMAILAGLFKAILPIKQVRLHSTTLRLRLARLVLSLPLMLISPTGSPFIDYMKNDHVQTSDPRTYILAHKAGETKSLFWIKHLV